jgi:hypothetical protein
LFVLKAIAGGRGRLGASRNSIDTGYVPASYCGSSIFFFS